jgi:Tol biopolymer transport system component
VVTLDGDVATVGEPLLTSVYAFGGVRVSPDGRKAAYVMKVGPEADEDGKLCVLSLDSGATPRVVAERSALHVDWSVDGRFVCYASTERTTERTLPLLGAIARRAVCDEGGQVLAAFPDAEQLAGIAYHPKTRVRCLPDGRIVFTAFEITLPCTDRDVMDPSLFSVDPGRQAVVTRLVPRQSQQELADGIEVFDPSPDGRHICIPAGGGEIMVLTLATGYVWTLHDESSTDKLRTLPAWRSNNELCFNYGDKEQSRLVLARLDWGEQTVSHKVLSGDWPIDVTEGFLLGGDAQGAEADETP